MSINNHYDVVFVGWGASACILMIEMDKQSLLSKKNILIIDPSDKQENDKTFCFWSKQEDEIYQNYKNIISKSWSSIQINDNKSFLINLDQSKIVNSIGASILIEIIEELQTVDGSLNFCNLAPIIAKTFKIMGLTKYCETFDDEDAALEKLV